MPDSLHDILINASPESVFKAWTTLEGQTAWWTKKCQMGNREKGATEEGADFLFRKPPKNRYNRRHAFFGR